MRKGTVMIRKTCGRECMGRTQERSQKEVSMLASSWKQIGDLLEQLSYEPYIDDQVEIEEVWDICAALIKNDEFEKEDWELRKTILSDIIKNDYYDEYGCCDSMLELSKRICTKPEEFLLFAEIMEQSGYYKKEAAYLYYQHGRDDKYVSYLETNLGKQSETYVALIEYYKEHNCFDEARRVAEQGLEKCKDDLTDIFIHLLVEAKKDKDEDKYKKLYTSAKRRRAADIFRIDKFMLEFEDF